MLFLGDRDLADWEERVNRLKFLTLVLVVSSGIGFWIAAWYRTTSLFRPVASPAARTVPGEVALAPDPVQI